MVKSGILRLCYTSSPNLRHHQYLFIINHPSFTIIVINPYSLIFCLSISFSYTFPKLFLLSIISYHVHIPLQ